MDDRGTKMTPSGRSIPLSDVPWVIGVTASRLFRSTTSLHMNEDAGTTRTLPSGPVCRYLGCQYRSAPMSGGGTALGKGVVVPPTATTAGTRTRIVS
jgi:hypothetical protein